MTIVDWSSDDSGRDCSMADAETVDELREFCEDTSKEIQSASIDPRQRIEETQRERFDDVQPECHEKPIPEQFNMIPQSDHSMFDFGELDNLEGRDTQQPTHEREYRGEDAIERLRLAERRRQS